MKKSIFLSLILGAAILTGCGNQAGVITHLSEDSSVSDGSTTEESVEESEASEAEKEIYVYVGGKVDNPGVYVLKEGARVYEAVNAAGGAVTDISASNINPVEILKDGDKIIVKGQEEEAAESAEESKDDGLVNINTADEAELKSLPGIGDVRAQAIIAYREKNGEFASVEDIKNVDGIKSGVYSKLEGLIKTE